MADTLHIDVALHPRLIRDHRADLVVLVDAVDGSPRLLEQLESGGQPVLGDESWDLVQAADGAALRHTGAEPPQLLLAGVVNARPAAAQIERWSGANELHELLIVCAGNGDAIASEDAYSAGLLVRMLLEELSQGLGLSDAAGIAIALTSSYPDPRSALLASAAVRQRLDSEADSDDSLGSWAAQDLVGVVGELRRSGALWCVDAWVPAQSSSGV